MKEKRPCEAPVHVDGCECRGCMERNCENCKNITLDHFTAKCIARSVLHWKPKETNSDENTQWLSLSCHKEKDRNTAERFYADRQQLKGGSVTLEDVRRWAKESQYNKNGNKNL